MAISSKVSLKLTEMHTLIVTVLVVVQSIQLRKQKDKEEKKRELNLVKEVWQGKR